MLEKANTAIKELLMMILMKTQKRKGESCRKIKGHSGKFWK